MSKILAAKSLKNFSISNTAAEEIKKAFDSYLITDYLIRVNVIVKKHSDEVTHEFNSIEDNELTERDVTAACNGIKVVVDIDLASWLDGVRLDYKEEEKVYYFSKF